MYASLGHLSLFEIVITYMNYNVFSHDGKKCVTRDPYKLGQILWHIAILVYS